MNNLARNVFDPVNVCEQSAEATAFEPFNDKATKPLTDYDLLHVGGGEAIVCW